MSYDALEWPLRPKAVVSAMHFGESGGSANGQKPTLLVLGWRASGRRFLENPICIRPGGLSGRLAPFIAFRRNYSFNDIGARILLSVTHGLLPSI